MTSQNHIEVVKNFLLTLQDQICAGLTTQDPQGFREDLWQRAAGGGGRTRVLENGSVFEKAGVNFSHVFGKELPPSATLQRPELSGQSFQALGVSLVIHPRNPYVPTSHANLRFFTTENPSQPGQAKTWWFGGGFDLTPYYGFDEDCRRWHHHARQACEILGPDAYPRYKHWCDDYFYLRHREEARGIGGLFFDDLNQPDFSTCLSFLQAVGQAYQDAYLPIVATRKHHAYGERERAFQCYRRGRYVEFNLLYDRGTLFGLQSKGRTESILMSLPPQVTWLYDWQAEPDSVEANFSRDFLQARDWLANINP